jgi:hypothetical protein
MSGPNIAELEVKRLTLRKKLRTSDFEYTTITYLDHLRRNLADAAGSTYDLWKTIRRLGFIPPNSFADKCPYFTQAIKNPECIKFNRYTAAILNQDDNNNNQALITNLERIVAGHQLDNSTIEPSSISNNNTTTTSILQSKQQQLILETSSQSQPLPNSRQYATGRTRRKPKYPIRDATMVSPVKSVMLVNIALVYLLFNAELVSKMF